MRFQTVLLAAVAAFGTTGFAQSSSASESSAASSAASSSASSSEVSSSASSSRASSSSAAASSSASSSITSSASVSSSTGSAAAASSGSSSSDDEEQTSTRVYTTTYYYITENPTHNAQSPTLLIQSVVRSTSGLSDQQSFSTPTGRVTVLDISKSTYTTTYTSENPIHAAQSQYFTITDTVTTTMGLPNTESSEGAAGRVGVKEVGGVAAFFLGLAGMYL